MKKTKQKVLPNTYTTQEDVVTLTAFNKKGKPYDVTFNVTHLELVQANGPYFLEWHKDFNAYLVLTSKKVNLNGRETYHKIPLATLILNCASTEPVLYQDQNTLNLCDDNLAIYDRYEQNEIEIQSNQTALITLKNKYGLAVGHAIIDEADLDSVVNDSYNWTVQKRLKGQPRVIANTKEGRVYLNQLLMQPATDERVKYLNKNPLDHRRQNLVLEKIELELDETADTTDSHA